MSVRHITCIYHVSAVCLNLLSKFYTLDLYVLSYFASFCLHDRYFTAYVINLAEWVLIYIHTCTDFFSFALNVVSCCVTNRGGFNGRPLVQWPTRPVRGPCGGPGRLNFGLQLQSPDCNLNWIYDLFKIETSTLIRSFEPNFNRARGLGSTVNSLSGGPGQSAA